MAVRRKDIREVADMLEQPAEDAEELAERILRHVEAKARRRVEWIVACQYADGSGKFGYVGFGWFATAQTVRRRAEELLQRSDSGAVAFIPVYDWSQRTVEPPEVGWSREPSPVEVAHVARALGIDDAAALKHIKRERSKKPPRSADAIAAAARKVMRDNDSTKLRRGRAA